MSKLDELKELALRNHYECEDCFYACPVAEEYCGNRGDECDCGADEHNAKVEKTFGEVLREIDEYANICIEKGMKIIEGD